MMKYTGTLIAVKDMEKSRQFYHDMIGLEVATDFGANVTLTGGLVLQTLETWQSFIHTGDVTLKSNAGELYFETEDMDAFMSIWSPLIFSTFTNCMNTLGASELSVFTILTDISSRPQKSWMPSLHILLHRECPRMRRQTEWLSRLTLWYQA